MDWFWTKSSIRSCVASGKKTRHPSSARRITSRSRCGEDRKMIFGTNFEYSQYWSDDVWISKMAGGGGNKKRFQYCVDPSGQEILYFQALQRHSGRRPIDPILQDNVLISNIFPLQAFYWMCNQFMLHHKFRIDGGRTIPAGKDRRYFWQLWIPWIRITRIRNWSNHVLHSTNQSGKDTGIRCIGSNFSLLNGKDWSSIKQDRTPSSSTIHSQLIASRKWLWSNLTKSFTRRFLCHFDQHRKFLTNTIGCVISIVMSLEAAKITNESNPYVGKSPQRKLRNVPCSITTLYIKKNLMSHTHSASTVRPVCGSESTKRCVLTPTHVEKDQTSTVRPALEDHKEEHEIDSGVPGLLHAVVKDAEHLRV